MTLAVLPRAAIVVVIVVVRVAEVRRQHLLRGRARVRFGAARRATVSRTSSPCTFWCG